MIVSLIVGFITAHAGLIFGSVIGLLGLGAAGVSHLKAKAATGQAQAAIAKVGEQQAQSEAAAQQRAAEVVQNQQAARAQTAKVPDDQVNEELKKLGGLRNE